MENAVVAAQEHGIAALQNLLDEQHLASRHPHGPRPGKPFTALAGLEVAF